MEKRTPLTLLEFSIENIHPLMLIRFRLAKLLTIIVKTDLIWASIMTGGPLCTSVFMRVLAVFTALVGGAWWRSKVAESGEVRVLERNW